MTTYLERDGGRIAYDLHGDAGPLVVAVPGIGDVRGVYRFLTPRLLGAGWRVATVDPRGVGESSTGWGEYSDRVVASDLVALVEHLDAGPAVLIGNSFSAASAVHVAADRPDLVTGLVLIGPFARSVPIPAWQGAMFRLLLRPPWGRAAWIWYYRSKLYPARKPDDFDAYVAALRANLGEPGRMDALRGFASDDHSGSGAKLDRVDVPSLIVMGTADPDFPDPEQEAAELAQRIGATVVLVDGAGHYPQAEFPDRVADAVIAFLPSSA